MLSAMCTMAILFVGQGNLGILWVKVKDNGVLTTTLQEKGFRFGSSLCTHANLWSLSICTSLHWAQCKAATLPRVDYCTILL
jgi:hypothetical protein